MNQSALRVLLVAVAKAARPVVLIDGGAGSGKSTFAAELAASWPVDGPAPHVVCTDQFCPGWDGLAQASAMVPTVIETGEFTEWDWVADQPGATRQLDPQRPLILEGCGALSPASRELATLAVWLDAPTELRKARALARDGELFAPHWQQWADQEAELWQQTRPWQLADIELDVD